MTRKVTGEHAGMRGMTLLELLVALAIMAISVTLIYRAVAGSAKGVAQVELSQGAALLADSLLDAYGMVDPMGLQASGQDGPYAWQVSAAPYAQAGLPENAVALYLVRITIGWADGRSWVLDTLRPRRPLQPNETTR